MRALSRRIAIGMMLGPSAEALHAAAPGGEGEPSLLGWMVVGGGALAVVLATFYYGVRCFRRPGEQDASHIKHRILRDDW